MQICIEKKWAKITINSNWLILKHLKMYEIISMYRDDVENKIQQYIFDISAQIREDRKVLSECFLYLSVASRSTGYFLYICNQTDPNPPAALSQATAKGVIPVTVRQSYFHHPLPLLTA